MMKLTQEKKSKIKNTAILIQEVKDISEIKLNNNEANYLEKQLKKDIPFNVVEINRYDEMLYVCIANKKKYRTLSEDWRLTGDKLQKYIWENKETELNVISYLSDKNNEIAFLEGVLLGTYYFSKYLTKKYDKLNNINIQQASFSTADLRELEFVCEAVIKARNLVNEPANALNAVSLAENFKQLGKEANFYTEVFDKKKIESLQFGGLLAVNQGSVIPPSFTIMEWKPTNAINEKPYVFVGKGVTFDSGGMNLKTGNYMNDMKSDMAGAAVVGGLMYAVAKNKLPVYIIGLVPATDNRVDGLPVISGDVITMFNKKTVEVTNTDAEGRLILADALSFADKYNPELIIDLATLTGAAARAIGHLGIVAMEKDAKQEMQKLKIAGEYVYERIVEFPFWHEYENLIKSTIADLDNTGSEGFGGAITAGKFLSNFTENPYIHLDIAGPAFVNKRFDYHGIGGTGIGLRLLYHFIKMKTKKNEN